MTAWLKSLSSFHDLRPELRAGDWVSEGQKRLMWMGHDSLNNRKCVRVEMMRGIRLWRMPYDVEARNAKNIASNTLGSYNTDSSTKFRAVHTKPTVGYGGFHEGFTPGSSYQGL